jgi:hypothetical protein
MTILFFFWLCISAFGLSTEKSGMIYYPNPGVANQGAATGRSVANLLTGIEARAETCTIKFTHTGSGDTTAYTFTTADVIPAYVTVEFEPGAMIDAPTVRVDIEGFIDAGRHQIYTTRSITPRFWEDTGGQIIYPEWTGLVMDGSTDSTDALQMSIDIAELVGTGHGDSDGPRGGHINFASGMFRASGVTINSPGVCLSGQGSKSTTWRGVAADDQYLLNIWYEGATPTEHHGFFRNFKMRSLLADANKGILRQQLVSRFEWDDVWFDGHSGMNFCVEQIGVITGSFNNCRFRSGQYSMKAYATGINGHNDISYNDCAFGSGVTFGAWIVGGANVNFNGGSFQACGTASGGTTTGGLFIDSPAAFGEGVGVSLDGVWFEGNKGTHVRATSTGSSQAKITSMRNVTAIGAAAEYGFVAEGDHDYAMNNCSWQNATVQDIREESTSNQGMVFFTNATVFRKLGLYSTEFPDTSARTFIETGLRVNIDYGAALTGTNHAFSVISDAEHVTNNAEMVYIESSAVTSDTNVMEIVNGTKGTGLRINHLDSGQTITATGEHGLYVYGNSADVNANSALFLLKQDNASATEPLLELVHDNSGATKIEDSTGAILSSTGTWDDAPSFSWLKTNISEFEFENSVEKLKGLQFYEYQLNLEVYGVKNPGPEAIPINPDAPYHIGYMLDYEDTPEEVKAKNSSGKVTGMNGVQNSIFLMGVIKELITRIEDLEAAE